MNTSLLKSVYRFSGIVLLLVCSFLHNNVLCKEYWIDPVEKWKNIECTKSEPCRNIHFIVNKLQPGDIVLLKNGNYERIYLRTIVGEPDNPIIIKAAGKHVYISPKNNNTRDSLEVARSEYLTIDGLKFVDAKRAAIRINDSTNITVKNSQIENSAMWGIFTNHTNYITLSDNRISGPSKEHGIYVSNSGDNISIKGNQINGPLGSGIHMNGDLKMGGGYYTDGDGVISDVVITRNLIENVGKSGGAAINLDGIERVRILENIIWNVNSAGITIFKQNGAIVSRDVHVENNIISLAEKSRWGLIAGKNSGSILFLNNIIISDNPIYGAFELYSGVKIDEGIISKVQRKLGFSTDSKLPIISNQNIFSLLGSTASVDGGIYKTLLDWGNFTKNSDKDSVELAKGEIYAQVTKIYENRLFSDIKLLNLVLLNN